jgi:hypothetical protein
MTPYQAKPADFPRPVGRTPEVDAGDVEECDCMDTELDAIVAADAADARELSQSPSHFRLT